MLIKDVIEMFHIHMAKRLPLNCKQLVAELQKHVNYAQCNFTLLFDVVKILRDTKLFVNLSFINRKLSFNPRF